MPENYCIPDARYFQVSQTSFIHPSPLITPGWFHWWGWRFVRMGWWKKWEGLLVLWRLVPTRWPLTPRLATALFLLPRGHGLLLLLLLPWRWDETNWLGLWLRKCPRAFLWSICTRLVTHLYFCMCTQYLECTCAVPKQVYSRLQNQLFHRQQHQFATNNKAVLPYFLYSKPFDAHTHTLRTSNICWLKYSWDLHIFNTWGDDTLNHFRATDQPTTHLDQAVCLLWLSGIRVVEYLHSHPLQRLYRVGWEQWRTEKWVVRVHVRTWLLSAHSILVCYIIW